ncbi:hypothetical protein BaRGS_00026384, partial [Batillaria attramentaria]
MLTQQIVQATPGGPHATHTGATTLKTQTQKSFIFRALPYLNHPPHRFDRLSSLIRGGGQSIRQKGAKSVRRPARRRPVPLFVQVARDKQSTDPGTPTSLPNAATVHKRFDFHLPHVLPVKETDPQRCSAGSRAGSASDQQ